MVIALPAHRLPTVEMWHKKLGISRIVNATVYSEEYLCNPNWTTQDPRVSGYRPGNAPDAEVKLDAHEHKLNRHWKEDPAEAHKRGDYKRAYEAKSITVRPVQENWRKLPWFKRRAHVKTETGTAPKDMKHAEELMKNAASAGSND